MKHKGKLILKPLNMHDMFNNGQSQEVPHKKIISIKSPNLPDLPNSALASAGNQARRFIMVKEAVEKPKHCDYK